MNVCSLFSGIGGIDLGFAQAGLNIIWANEIDPAACKTYRHNFKNSKLVQGDIKKIAPHSIPDFDVLVAGFPCQSFSIAGKQRGFNDRRGNLFFEITKIVDIKRPKVVFLENVANLLEHDNGRTFLVIYNCLAQFGYSVYYKVMSAADYGNIPQNRQRIYIVAVKENEGLKYTHPSPVGLTVSTSDIVHRSERKNDIYYYKTGKMTDFLERKVIDKSAIYNMHDSLALRPKNRLCPTLTASMGMYDDMVPVLRDDFGVRKLTLRECLDFQGFPPDFYFPNTITINDAYKQIGNSVCVPVIRIIAENIRKTLQR